MSKSYRETDYLFIRVGPLKYKGLFSVEEVSIGEKVKHQWPLIKNVIENNLTVKEVRFYGMTNRHNPTQEEHRLQHCTSFLLFQFPFHLSDCISDGANHSQSESSLLSYFPICQSSLEMLKA